MKLRILVLVLLCCLLLTNAIAENLGTPAPKVDPLSSLQYAEVTTDKGHLNMRISPKSSGTVLKRIPNHTIVLVIEPDDDWSKIAYDGKEGYVISDYLSILDDLPYSTLEQGAHGKEVLNLKKRLQELGYFRSGAADMTNSFTETLANRIMIFQQLNGLEQTGIATPELQAFIFWGNALKNDGYLPPAPYYVSGNNGEATDPTSGLSAKITCTRTGYSYISNDTEIQNYYSVSVNVTGGNPAKYDVSVYYRLAEGGTHQIDGNTFSVVYEVGGQYDGFDVYAHVTDADGNSVTVNTAAMFYIPPLEESDDEIN